MHEKTDYKVNGIIPFELKRFYRSGDADIGAFGTGTYFGYDWWLGVYSDVLLLLMPGNYQYRFYKQPDGTFVNTTRRQRVSTLYKLHFLWCDDQFFNVDNRRQ